MRRLHHRIGRALTHPNRLVAAMAWLLLIAVVLVLTRLAVVVLGDFWVTAIAWLQP